MFKNIKSLFIIEEEQTPKKGKTPTKKTTSPPKETITQPTTKAKVSEGKVSDKFTNILFGAMDANNIQGFDYLEFKHSLKSLANVQMDEKTRFQSAAAMAQTMGADMNHVVKTASHYLDVLSKEESKFLQTLEAQRKQRIGDKAEELTQIENAAKQKAAEITQLQKEIEQLKVEAQNVQQEIDTATIKITSTGNDFEASYSAVRTQIETDVQKIKEYLG